jgi:hypothetical protein
VAKAVQYLASDESQCTIGSEIVVDGGRTLNGWLQTTLMELSHVDAFFQSLSYHRSKPQ